jgi:hypothetical protein
MRRCFEPVDLMVLVGVCATVLAAHLFFAASNGTLQSTVSHGDGVSSTSIVDAMEWIQPALGQAIMQDAVLAQEASGKIVDAAMQLNRAIVAGELAEASSSVWLDRLRSRAARAEAEHAATVQFVQGRKIVEFTKRGLRTGALTADGLTAAYNRRMIDLTQATGQRMEAQFRGTQQTNLGGEIVSAIQQLDTLRAQTQQRLGRTIVAMSSVQDRYGSAFGALQEQLGAIAFASAGTELRADLFDRLPAADYPTAERATFVPPRSWAAIPFGMLLAATVALMALFVMGLRIAAGRPEDEVAEDARAERLAAGRHVRVDIGPDLMPESYRKSA